MDIKEFFGGIFGDKVDNRENCAWCGGNGHYPTGVTCVMCNGTGLKSSKT